ncbi:MAG: hypothetical protein ABIH42_01165 [Planctomycetota bacterium]
MNWWQALQQVSISAIIVAALVWLARKIFEHWFDKDLESYKNKMALEQEVQLEKLRNELKIQAVEHEIKFRSMHEKQAEVIAETYSLLQKFSNAVSSYVSIYEISGELNKEEKYTIVKKALEEFKNYFLPNKLFFPKHTMKQIDELAKKLFETSEDFTWEVLIPKINNETNSKNLSQRWYECYQITKEDIPPLLAKMESYFQKLLGVSQNTEINNHEKETIISEKHRDTQ